MGLKVITPIPITDSILTSSTVPEPDTGENLWLVGTTYALGYVVYLNHKLYESVANGNTGNDPEDDIQNDPANPPLYWLDLKQNTNQWAMFDNKRSTQTIGTSPMEIVLEPVQNLTSIGLFNIDAQTVRIQGETAGLFCTRATDGTFINSEGLLETAPPNTARYSYDPANLSLPPVLLDEDAATNLLLQSNEFATSPWVATGTGNITKNALSIDGTTNAWTFEDADVAATAARRQTLAIPNDSAFYCASVYCEAGTTGLLYFRQAMTGGTTVVNTAVFDITNKTWLSGTGGGYIDAGSGKLRVWVIFQNNSTGNTTFDFRVGATSTSNADIGTVIFEKAQLEVGLFPTSYINTTLTALTRDADIINPSQGVQYDQTFEMATRNPIDFLEWFTSPFKFKKSVVVFDIPPFIDMTFTITFTATSGTVKCGAVVIGNFTDIGDILYGAKNTATNYSRIENQLDGSLLLTKRRSVPEMTLKLSSPHAILDSLLELRDDQLNAEPTAWIGLSQDNEDLYQAFEMLGVYRQFEIDVENPARLLIDLKVMEIM